jgi:transposase
MSVVILTPQERASLQQVASDAILLPIARRAQALLWLADGKSLSDVAKSLAVSRQAVYNWIESFQQRHRDADIVTSLRDKPRSGRPPRRPHMRTLPTPQALDPLVAAVIRRAPRECGYRSLLWTAKLLRQYLQEVHNVKVTVANVRSAVARLETRWQPATVLAGDRPQDKVA